MPNTMRAVLLLHPGYTFPHPMESFPYDMHFYHWLSLHNDHSLVIIGNCHWQIPQAYKEKILFFPVSYSPSKARFASFWYRWKVHRILKNIGSGRLFFDRFQTFSFFVRRRSFSVLFPRLFGNDSLIIEEADRMKYDAALRGRILHIPLIPSPVFTCTDASVHNEIKASLTNGAEYFLCTARFKDPQQLTLLLKAYSLFKQRLKSNFKLVLSGVHSQEKQLLRLLSHYKYRQDVVIACKMHSYSLASLLSAAYAHISLSSEAYDSCTYADCAASRVPAIYPQGKHKAQIFPEEITFREGDVQDLAQKMMWVYKDEAGRSRIIQQRFAYFQPSHKPFDFSSYL
jgi:hypothetical protein